MPRIAALLALLAVLALLAATPAAHAQSSPFGPLPPPAPTATPEDSGDTNVLGQDVGRSTLYLIAGGFLLAFVGIGVMISRDARRTLPREQRDDSRRGVDPRERGRQRERAKVQARAKTRAQKAARKAARKRR